MPLNEETCGDAFVQAMRERLEIGCPEHAQNVELKDVKENLHALGHAVFDILIGLAVTRSDTATAKDFWDWIGDVHRYINAIDVWQNDLQTLLDTWAGDPLSTLADLKGAITQLDAPVAGPPTDAPSELVGRIE